MTCLYDGMLKVCVCVCAYEIKWVCVCVCERERESACVMGGEKREEKFPSGFGIIWTNPVVDDSVEVGVKKGK